MIPKEVVEEIRDRCDIEEVVGQYVSLKRAGSNRNGLCPFHSEKTPSFTVFPATRSFYCFGCGAGGDVITFIQKIENLDYVDALEFLAARAGISIPNDVTAVRGPQISRRRIYDMNLAAARFFRDCLFDPVLGREGLLYLSQTRALSPAVIKHFGLGFAPNDFTLLTRHMRAAGFTEEELTVGFLSKRSPNTGGLIDLFRNRVMFPVIDTAGNIVAFGGRVMDDSKPKYLNSSDTPGFKKSRVLFGLNFARQVCAEEMILCEGYMDTIAIQAAGFENAVATLGTAITPEHARLLARYTQKVVLNYDSDEAGQRAADKAIKLLGEVGLPVRVLKLSGAKDADEYIRKFGAKAFAQTLKESRTAFDFRMESALSHFDLSATDGKIRAARAMAELIAGTSSGVERELYTKKAAERLGVSPESLGNDIARVRKKRETEWKKKESRELQLSVRNFGDRVNPDAAKDPGTAAAEATLLGLILLFPEHRHALATGEVPLTEADFFTAFGRRVFRAVMEGEKSPGGFSFSALGEQFSPDEMGRLVAYEQERQNLTENGRELLLSVAEKLRVSREKREAKNAGDWQSEILRRRSEISKQKNEEEKA